jgi:hypothetical protein
MAKDRQDTGEVAAIENGYGEELLSANWNPVIALLEWSCAHTTEACARDRVAEEDAEGFLGRFYSLGG